MGDFVWGNLSWRILSHKFFSLGDFVAGRFCHGGFCHGGFCQEGFCHGGFCYELSKLSSVFVLVTALSAAGDTIGAPGLIGLTFFPILDIMLIDV